MTGKLLKTLLIIAILAAGIYSFNYLDYAQKMNPQALITALTNDESNLEEGAHGGDRPFPDGGGGHRAEGNLPGGGGFHQGEGGSLPGANLNQILAFAGVFALTVAFTSLADRKWVKRNSNLPETVL